VEGQGSRHSRHCVVHASACVGHALARGGRMGKQLVAKRSRGSPDHGKVVHVVVKLHEVDRSDFEKNQI
jgi:hypothetical protein